MSDVYELALYLSGLSEDDGPDWDVIDEALYERFEARSDQLHDIAKALLPLIKIAQGPLTGTVYAGFAANGVWLLKGVAE